MARACSGVKGTSANYLVVGNNLYGPKPTGAFSCAIWVRLTGTVPDTGGSGIFGRWTSGGGTPKGFLAWISNVDGQFQVFINGNSVDSNYTVPLNTWVHLGMSWDGSNELIAWVNGANAASGTGFTSITYGGDSFIMGNYDSIDERHKYFPGDLCECGAWDGVLSTMQWEALAHGASPLLVSPQTLTHYYMLRGRSTEMDELNSDGLGVITLTNSGGGGSGPVHAFHPPIYYPEYPSALEFPLFVPAAVGQQAIYWM